jgi:CitB family two-component system sensor histidine kinase MalK
MAKRLSGVTNYADTLRAQTHEFMNKMHVIKGLIYTNDISELKKYISDITDSSKDDLKEINSKIHNPVLAAFLFGKKSRAQEKMVDFSLTEESDFPEELANKVDVHELIVIIGNLLENSFDILQKKKDERLVNLAIIPYDEELVLQVENNGEAIAQEDIDKIFVKGYTTKGQGHGFGLALLKQHLDSMHGKIQVESDELNGTEFIVEIPLKED